MLRAGMVGKQLVILYIFKAAKDAVMIVNVPICFDQIGR